MTAIVARLEDLAQHDAVLAPLARLYVLVLRLIDTTESSLVAVPSTQRPPESHLSVPLLHQQTLAIDLGMLERLLQEASELLAEHGLPKTQALVEAVAQRRLSALELLQAGVQGNAVAFEQLARSTRVAVQLMTVLGNVLSIPVLALASRVISFREPLRWQVGYCPHCAAWPILAEFRGLERERWLRCGRCGTGWRYPHQQCPFCENSDHRSLRYFAEEGKQDSQRVEVCEQCRGYLKTFATLGPWSLGEILLQDLATVEFDFLAQDRGYQRPEGLGYPLEVQIVAQELLA